MSDFKGFNDWFEIFKGGLQTDSEGRQHDGDQVIQEALDTFDPAEHEPPICIGHPAGNSPAYGWVSKLKEGFRDGKKILLAKAKDVSSKFEGMLKKGSIKKRSASFYPDGRLRHIGFLGAMPPAVKGLLDMRFMEGEYMTFDFAATDEEKSAQKTRAGKYKIGIKEGGHVTKPAEWAKVDDTAWLDPVNYRYPCPDAAQTRAAAAYWGKPKNKEQYSSEEQGIMDARLDRLCQCPPPVGCETRRI